MKNFYNKYQEYIIGGSLALAFFPAIYTFCWILVELSKLR